MQQQLHQLRPARQYPSRERSGGGFLACDVDRAGFRVRHLDTTHDDARRCTVTAAMKVSTIVRATVTITATVRMSSAPMVLTTSTSAVELAMILGVPLRGRAFRSNLRFAPISTAIPDASAPSGRCALRLPGGSLRSPPLPGRHARGEARRLRRLDRHGPRLVAAALRAPPLSASPSTGSRIARCTRALAPAERTRTSLRTTPCSRVRTSADTAAGVFAAVPRTTPCSIRCTPVRSSAAAAPTSRCHRRRFPELRCSSIGRPGPPGAASGFTPHASLMQACHGGPCRALAGPFGANGGHAVVGASELRAKLADRHRHGPAWPRVRPRATRAQLAGFRIVFREFRLKLARVAYEFRP